MDKKKTSMKKRAEEKGDSEKNPNFMIFSIFFLEEKNKGKKLLGTQEKGDGMERKTIMWILV